MERDNAGEVLTGLTFTSGNAAVNAENFQYGYNTAQNMVARTNNTTVNSYTVNTLNQATTDGSGYTLAYDNNGNRTGRLQSGSFFYVYDDENQLISAATDTTAWPVASRWKTEWTYDARGRMRTRKEYTHSGASWILGSETRYLYDGRRVIQERNGSNLPLVTYVRGLDLSGTFEGAGGIGGMLSRTAHSGANGATLTHAFYHADANGNITKMVNTSQASVADYKYDPFGRTISSSGTLAAANTYQFSSKELMAKSGFYYYGFRFYDPQTQRWLNRDPMGEGGGINLYTAVANDPIDGVDAWGFCEMLRQPGLIDDEFGGSNPPLSLWDRLNSPLYVNGNRVLTGWPLALGPGGGLGGFGRASGLPTPKVLDPKLGRYMDMMYKGAKVRNPIGTGSTADAVRSELATGKQVGNRWHSQKAQELINGLRNWLKNNPNAAPYDKIAARSAECDLSSALNGN